MTPFQLVDGRTATTTLDCMLTVREDENGDYFARRAEEARQLARQRIQRRQSSDASRYKHRRAVFYEPGDAVWVWTPVRQRGRSEKLLRRYFGPYKVVGRLLATSTMK